MGLMIIVSVLFYLMMVDSVIGNVVLMGRNVSRSFEDMEATFTPQIKGSGESGLLYLADPLDACSPLMNKVVGSSKSSFALIIRGACSFDDKVRHAQNAGFKAAIIYDFEDGSPLVAMGGSPGGIKIPAVFISKAAGTILKTYAGLKDIELWILPTIENSAWSIMAVSFISLLAVSAMLATCFFVRRQHVRSEMPRTPQEFYGMSRRMVKAMPSLIFTTVLEDNCSSVTCAICLEDYKAGDKLRILPCCHKFHAFCVDSWLTSWRTFCPMCKRDARTNIPIPPPSESTPLLSSVSPSPSPSSTIRSYHSSLVASPPVPIVSTPPWSPSTSRNHSLSSSHRMTNSHKSSNNLPGIYIHRSSADLRNVNSSQRSQTSHFMTPRSVGVPMSSPYGSRYICAYNQSSSNASPIYLVGSSSRPSYLRHCESGASISALASAQSLPSC